MTGKREAKKADLKERLVVAARALISEQGLGELRARDIAARAGSALGGLYTVFEDIDALVLAVNSQTLHEMRLALQHKVLNAPENGNIFKTLSLAYLDFARENRHLWSALFEHRMPGNTPVPEWHLGEHEFLIGFIAAPLSAAMPGVAPENIATRARTLFASVHGVIALSLENRFVGLPLERLAEEVAALADILSRGLTR